MPCADCGTYWECGPDPLDLCQGGVLEPFSVASGGESEAGDWTVVGEQHLNADTPYYLKCNPAGCDAKVEEDDTPPGPAWKVYGPLQVPTSGTYLIGCRHGSGGCYVGLKLLSGS